MLKFKPLNASLSQYYQKNDFNSINQLINLQAKEKRNFDDDKKKGASITGHFSFLSWQPNNYCHIAHPQFEDLIIYHASSNGDRENHIGIYKGGGMVESKFGYGNVYLHPIHYVPNCYGPYVSFFTPQKSNILGNEATIENMEQWIEIYGSICSLHINFTNKLSTTRMENLLQFLDSNPNFSKSGETCSFNLETGASTSSYTYQVKPDFLLAPKQRQILIELYDSKRKKLEIEQESQRSNQISKQIRPTSFSYTLHEALLLLQDENLLIFPEEKHITSTWKRLKRHPLWQNEQANENIECNNSYNNKSTVKLNK